MERLAETRRGVLLFAASGVSARKKELTNRNGLAPALGSEPPWSWSGDRRRGVRRDRYRRLVEAPLVASFSRVLLAVSAKVG